MTITEDQIMKTVEIGDGDSDLNPFWRWEEANRIVDNSINTISEDKSIRITVEYLRSPDASQFSLIEEAFDIYDSDGLMRAEIEARVLAKQSITDISKCCNISTVLIGTYETIFFDVRRYLESTDWVIRKTVGADRPSGFQNHELRQLFAFFALSGGEFILDEMVDSFKKVARSDKEMKISLYLKKNVDVRKDLQACIAIHTIPQYGVGSKWFTEYQVQIMEAQVSKNPVLMEQVINHIQTEVILLAQKYLAGKSIEKPPARKQDTKTVSESTHAVNLVKHMQEQVLKNTK